AHEEAGVVPRAGIAAGAHLDGAVAGLAGLDDAVAALVALNHGEVAARAGHHEREHRRPESDHRCPLFYGTLNGSSLVSPGRPARGGFWAGRRRALPRCRVAGGVRTFLVTGSASSATVIAPSRAADTGSDRVRWPAALKVSMTSPVAASSSICPGAEPSSAP